MGYSTPHHAREFLVGASLAVVHDYQLRCQRRATSDKKALLGSTREIDLCSRLGAYFGPNAHLAAQGTNDIDLVVTGPTIRVEVKYFRPPARQWAILKDDWDWLLATSNTNDEFRRRAWVVFWPSATADMYKFTNCLSVTRKPGCAVLAARLRTLRAVCRARASRERTKPAPTLQGARPIVIDPAGRRQARSCRCGR